jgi:hypothetical protein
MTFHILLATIEMKDINQQTAQYKNNRNNNSEKRPQPYIIHSQYFPQFFGTEHNIEH